MEQLPAVTQGQMSHWSCGKAVYGKEHWNLAHVSVPPETIEQVRLRLADIKSASPDYWPTVVRFLQFATAGLFPNAPPPGGTPLTIAQLTASGTVSSQTIELEDGIRLDNITFVNCRIIFTENPVEFHNVRFVGSAIEFK